jgi:predicted metal-dependent enzyme (double-stranded beta helix superfamily)
MAADASEPSAHRISRMCDLGQHHHHQDFGFLVDSPAIRELVSATERASRDLHDPRARVEALKPAFSALLGADGWLPDAYAQPDLESGMGGGIGQYALYRAQDGSLCLFSLVIPPGKETPVHDHLAWGLIGVYRGRQDETVYRRLDAGDDAARADLEVARRQTVNAGEFYALVPPTDDIHYVKTVSDVPSVSIHLLANDTACVWRHRFNPEQGTVTPFRSGYSNARCSGD